MHVVSRPEEQLSHSSAQFEGLLFRQMASEHCLMLQLSSRLSARSLLTAVQAWEAGVPSQRGRCFRSLHRFVQVAQPLFVSFLSQL